MERRWLLLAVLCQSSYADDTDLDCVIGDATGAVSLFKNNGNKLKPRFCTAISQADASITPTCTAETGTTNPFDGLDIGSNSVPHCLDLDNDGDYDCLIGEAAGGIAYLKNVGGATKAVYVRMVGSDNPFNGVSTGTYATIACKDLDNDGDFDCVLGGAGGEFLYYQNDGSITAPTFTAKTGADNPFNGVDLGTFSAISFADFDGDLDYDACVVGMDATGTTTSGKYYYKNTGSRTAPVFVSQTSTANIFDVSTLTALRLLPFCYDTDGDADIDCIFGTSTGVIEYIRNTGTATAPAYTHMTNVHATFPADVAEHPSQWWGIDVGTYSAPTCFNIDAECTSLSRCSSHGVCKHPSQCDCFDGWGSATDVLATGFAGTNDCSAR
jgi:hypothetical protein